MANTYFNLHSAIVRQHDNKIKSWKTADGKTQHYDNISANSFKDLPFVVNTLLYDGYYGITDIKMFVNDNLQHDVKVPGLLDCVERAHADRDAAEFAGNPSLTPDGNWVFQPAPISFRPFSRGFQNARTISDLCVSLSSHSDSHQDIVDGDKLTFNLTLTQQ